MSKEIMIVVIDRDPVPGAGHEPGDHARWLQNYLENLVPWYKPRVKLFEGIGDLDILFPDFETRPLHSEIELQQAYVAGLEMRHE